jgi:hypothetical protein
MFDKLMGIPISVEISSDICDMRAPNASPRRAINFERSKAGVEDQSENAARAAATARSTSSELPAGTLPTVASV